MNLKEWRESKGLTQAQAANLIGTVQGLWSRWENGGTQPTLKWALLIQEKTGGDVTLLDLVKKSTGG